MPEDTCDYGFLKSIKAPAAAAASGRLSSLVPKIEASVIKSTQQWHDGVIDHTTQQNEDKLV